MTRTTDTRGAELYTRYCAMCHGETGGQDGFNARYLPVKPARLSDGLKMSKRPDDTIYDVLAVGDLFSVSPTECRRGEKR